METKLNVMGLQIHIKLKDGADIEKINAYLRKHKVCTFRTEQDNILDLKAINTDPTSPQAHLKPAGRDLTMAEFQKIFGSWAEVNLLEFDIYFGRTTQEQINHYCHIIYDYCTQIEYITHVPDIIERYAVSPNTQEWMWKLYKPPVEPEKLPAEEQRKNNLDGGLFLCNSFSIEPFWVIFGRVDSPKFLKDKIYKDDLYNNIYRDKKGYAYLMLPLLPLNDKALDFVEQVYKDAWDMGLREAFTLLIPLVYHFELADIDAAADDFIYLYDKPDTLENKFRQVFKFIRSSHEYSDNIYTGFHYSEVQHQFRTNATNTVLKAQIGVLTALLKAVEKQNGKNEADKLLAECEKEKTS